MIDFIDFFQRKDLVMLIMQIDGHCILFGTKTDEDVSFSGKASSFLVVFH